MGAGARAGVCRERPLSGASSKPTLKVTHAVKAAGRRLASVPPESIGRDGWRLSPLLVPIGLAFVLVALLATPAGAAENDPRGTCRSYIPEGEERGFTAYVQRGKVVRTEPWYDSWGGHWEQHEINVDAWTRRPLDSTTFSSTNASATVSWAYTLVGSTQVVSGAGAMSLVPSGAYVATCTLTFPDESTATTDFVFQIDRTPPTCAPHALPAAGNDGWLVATGTATFRAGDAGDRNSGVREMWVFDHQTQLDVRPPAGADSVGVPVAEGVQKFMCWAFDNSKGRDNRGNAVATEHILKVDATAPTCAIAIDGVRGRAGWWVQPPTATLTVADSGSGVANVRHRIDGEPWIEGSGPVRIPDGEHVVACEVTDLAGNVGERRETVRTDATPPDCILTITGTPGNPGWWRSAVRVEILAGDDASGIEHAAYRLDALDEQEFDSAAGIDVLDQDRPHRIVCHALDVAGNALERSLDFAIDFVPPTCMVMPPRNGPPDGYLPPVRVGYSIFDDVATPETWTADWTRPGKTRIQEAYLEVDGRPYAFAELVGSFVLDEPGTYVVACGAIDVAGNVAEPVSETIVVREPPADGEEHVAGGGAPPAESSPPGTTEELAKETSGHPGAATEDGVIPEGPSWQPPSAVVVQYIQIFIRDGQAGAAFFVVSKDGPNRQLNITPGQLVVINVTNEASGSHAFSIERITAVHPAGMAGGDARVPVGEGGLGFGSHAVLAFWPPVDGATRNYACPLHPEAMRGTIQAMTSNATGIRVAAPEPAARSPVPGLEAALAAAGVLAAAAGTGRRKAP